MSGTEFYDRYGPAAVVTGASSGIGKAFAEDLAARGFNLLISARRVERLEDLAEALRTAHGVEVRIVAADLARADAAARIVAAARDLDVGLLVSNAGFGLKGAFEAGDAAVLREIVEVNCQTPMALAHGFTPRLKARGRGGIVFTSSVEGLIGCPYSAAYAASKALVVSLGEALWAELAPNVDVLTLCPGATDTEAAAKQGIDPKTLHNVMQPEEVARLALENIAEGPTFVPSAHYRGLFDQLRAMPRRDALRAMAGSMRPR